MAEIEDLKCEIERLRTENDLLRREGELFRSVFVEGSLGIAMIGNDLRFQHVNPALAAMLGRPQVGLVGMPVSEVTHPEDIDKTRDLAQSLFRNEIPAYRVEKRYVRGDGVTIWVHVTATAVRNASGVPLFGLAMIEDITERRQYNQEREQLVGQLREALGSVKTLSGLLPMCAWCKRIRDDQGMWSQVEQYVHRRTGADFTHGICPDCQDQVRRDLGLSPDDKVAP